MIRRGQMKGGGGFGSPGARTDSLSRFGIECRSSKGDNLRPVVFDKAAATSPNPATNLGLLTGAVFQGFRRDERDRRPARKTVTAQLLGDPAPDRVVPDIPDDDGPGRRKPSPIHLTFREIGKSPYGDAL